MAAVHRYVNNSVAGSGDGTTNGEGSGGTNAYIDLATWEAAEQTNLVTATDTHTVHCSMGSTTSTLDDGCTIVGWTCSATYFVTVRGHDADSPDQTNSGSGRNTTGLLDQVNYFTVNNGSFTQIELREASIVIENLQIVSSRSGGSNRGITTNSAFTNEPVIRGNIFTETAGTSGTGIYLDNIFSSSTAHIYNNVFYGFNRAALFLDTAGAVNIYNNTMYDCDEALEIASSQSGTVTCKNNAMVNSGTTDMSDAGSATLDFDYNATDDPASGTGDPRGTNGQDFNDDTALWDAAFTARGSSDFRIASTASLLYGTGISNASDANVPTTDILGELRTVWDIGAFAFAAAGSAVPTLSDGGLSGGFQPLFGGLN